MNISQFLLILRAHLRIILGTLAFTLVATVVGSLLWPKTYKATTSLVLNYKGTDPVTGLTIPAQLMPGYMATQIDIITSKKVSLKVVDDLKLTQGAGVQQQFLEATKGEGTMRDWLADLLLNKVDVTPSRESSVLDVSFKGSDPQFAAAIANAFASAYQQTSIELKVEPLKKAATYFNDQIKVLRDNLDLAQQKLTRYQQDNGLVSTDNRLDIESARLNELSSQLVGAQGQLMEAASRQAQAKGGATESPDVMSNPLVQNLKASLAQTEAKFSEISTRLEHNHPQYQSAKAELDKLRAELNRAIANASTSVGTNARIFSQRESEIRAALAAQKAKVLQLNRTRDELTLLTREVENAQRAYDTTTQRFTQTNLEGQSNQSDVAVLSPAQPPITPASPKLLINTLVAVFAGTFLGLGVALLVELLDRRVRSSADLSESLQVPVLGAMTWHAPPRRRARLIRFLLPRKLTTSAPALS